MGGISTEAESQRERPGQERPRTTNATYHINLHLGHFEIGRPLGRGKYGRIYFARHLSTNFNCALKVLRKAEFIVQGEERVFHNDTRVILILEYASGGVLFTNKWIMHRDTKPENIFLGLHGKLKLAHFGYSMHSSSNLHLWSLAVLANDFLIGKARLKGYSLDITMFLPEAKAFVRACDPSRRFSLENVLQRPWISKHRGTEN
ncbi:kinase-like protein [Lepidopterella palustris CBS 459.81]|uniref:Kinase-like protein n=1 Tax=Lepidopterella palustris CBS 459.81 TaxID=1314670 RepID=A0A8E2EDN5_9PEZI|nr:kinase-like protein [Lepidopterella palustris CBS 459.81]